MKQKTVTMPLELAERLMFVVDVAENIVRDRSNRATDEATKQHFAEIADKRLALFREIQALVHSGK
jgi:hypothetical protein